MNNFQKYVSKMLKEMCESLTIDIDFINQDISIAIQRYYVQAGPWAEILREG